MLTLDSILERSSPSGDCLEWSRCRSSDGYGSVWVPGLGMRGAHRIAYELAHDVKLAQGVEVRHTCDNPPCVNPDHLISGTHADNMHDMALRGRAVCHKSKKLTQEKADEIRRLFVRTGPRKSNAAELAERFGVTRQSIYGIANGHRWKAVI